MPFYIIISGICIMPKKSKIEPENEDGVMNWYKSKGVQKLIEKEELSKEDIATYGQVQERKGQLLNLIESNLADHPEESSQLKEIVEDWAELKIEAFHNRRSWVRATPSD